MAVVSTGGSGVNWWQWCNPVAVASPGGSGVTRWQWCHPVAVVHKKLILNCENVLWITVRITKVLTKLLHIICKHFHLGNPKNKIDNYSVFLIFIYTYVCFYNYYLWHTLKCDFVRKSCYCGTLTDISVGYISPFVVWLAVANYMFVQLYPMWQINHSFRDKRIILHTNNHGIENR